MPSKFEETVTDLGLKYRSGKQAILEKDKSKITAKDTKKLGGSVNLDKDLSERYPRDNRWDYVVAYNSGNKTSLFFIEVHPACSGSNANEVAAKKRWLDNWLATEGHSLISFASNIKKVFYWVTTDKTPPLGSKAHKICAKKGICGPVSGLKID